MLIAHTQGDEPELLERMPFCDCGNRIGVGFHILDGPP